MHTILTTVGTSLLTNARRALEVERLSEHQALHYLRQTDPVRASAESNSLSRLLEPGDAIVLIHSQTDDGKFCAESLRKHYVGRGFRSEVGEIVDLSYKESRFKMRGLRALVSTLVELIRAHRKEGRQVLINATGGFKAEIAYATLVGLLFDVPVYYIHEIFNEIIEMPPTPVGWDHTLIAENEEFFEWLSEEMRTSAEVAQRTRALPHEVHLLLAEEEGYTFLSAAGEAFFESYRDRLARAQAVPVLLSRPAGEAYRTAAPDTRRMFDRILSKLRIRELRRSGSDQVRNCDCFIFPKGNRDGRVFYVEGAEGALRVLEMARHSDESYERLIDRGVKPESYDTFLPYAETV